jgi:hypothetical protein
MLQGPFALHRALARVPAGTVAGVLLAVGLFGRAGVAEACSCSDPFANELRAGDGRIPVNAGGVPWWFPGEAVRPDLASLSLDELDELSLDEDIYSPRESLVTLERLNGDALEEVEAIVEPFAGAHVIRPRVPWVVGERYRVGVDAGPATVSAEHRFRTVEIEVVEAFDDPAPPRLFTSEPWQAPIGLMDRSGSCSAEFEAVQVTLSLGPEGDPRSWPHGILFYETWVDGQLWAPSSSFCETVEPGASWVQRGGDRLVATCSGAMLPGLLSEGEHDPWPADPSVSLSEGEHRVVMRARLPGTALVVESEEVVVNLRCRDEDGVGGGEAPEDAAGEPGVATGDADDLPGQLPVASGSLRGTPADGRAPLELAAPPRAGGCAVLAADDQRSTGVPALAMLGLAALCAAR